MLKASRRQKSVWDQADMDSGRRRNDPVDMKESAPHKDRETL
jgi:hypothetical protein